MKKTLISIAIITILSMTLNGCFEHKKAEKSSKADLKQIGGADTPEKAMSGFCAAMGQRDFEGASIMIWNDDWYGDPQNLEFQRSTFVENMYKQGWKADDRDFTKIEIKSTTVVTTDEVEMQVAIGSRKGFMTDYPYKVVKRQNRWYVLMESLTGTFGINL